jgi:hypothetical protein
MLTVAYDRRAAIGGAMRFEEACNRKGAARRGSEDHTKLAVDYAP